MGHVPDQLTLNAPQMIVISDITVILSRPVFGNESPDLAFTGQKIQVPVHGAQADAGHDFSRLFEYPISIRMGPGRSQDAENQCPLTAVLDRFHC